MYEKSPETQLCSCRRTTDTFQESLGNDKPPNPDNDQWILGETTITSCKPNLNAKLDTKTQSAAHISNSKQRENHTLVYYLQGLDQCLLKF